MFDNIEKKCGYFFETDNINNIFWTKNKKDLYTLLHINNYVNTHKLREKHTIKPDAALCKLLGISAGTEFTIFTLQTYLKPHYPKTNKPSQ